VTDSVEKAIDLQIPLLACLGVFDGNVREEVLQTSQSAKHYARKWSNLLTPSPFASTGAEFQMTSTLGWLSRRFAITLLARS
jgi:hypothetical protein